MAKPLEIVQLSRFGWFFERSDVAASDDLDGAEVVNEIALDAVMGFVGVQNVFGLYGNDRLRNVGSDG